MIFERIQEVIDYNPETGELKRKDRKYQPKSVGSHGYRQITIDGKQWLFHNLIWIYMTGELPKGEVDHINHIRTDNRWDNLRDIPMAQNRAEIRMRKDNPSGYTGVMKAKNKWCARIQVNGKKKHLGTFNTIEEAIAARKKAEEEYVQKEKDRN